MFIDPSALINIADTASDVANSKLFTTLVQVAAYITPYFLIPAAFRAGMGVFGALTGMLNDRSRGFFDRQRKTRQGQYAKTWDKTRSGNRWAGGNDRNLRGKLNRGFANTANAPGAILDRGNLLKPGQWAASTRSATSARNQAAIEQTMKENQNYQSWMHNDGLNRAAAETNNSKELRDSLVKNYGFRPGQQLDKAVSDVEAVRRTMNPDAFRQMTTLQAIAGGTTYKGSGEVAAAIGRATGNDDNARAWMVANARSSAMKSGRIDHGGMGFNDLYNEAGEFARQMGSGADITSARVTNADGVEVETNALIRDSTARLNERVYDGQGGSSLVHSSMKAEAVKQLAPEMVRTIEASIANGDGRDAAQRFASLAAVYDGLQGSSPEKARIVADSVMNQSVDVDALPLEIRQKIKGQDGNTLSGTITYQQAIESMRGDSEFQQMRREYQRQIDADRSRPIDPSAQPGQLPPNPFG